MKKFVNRADDIVAETLSGFAVAHRDLVRLHDRPCFLARADGPIAGKVGLVSGGGSGHEPLHIGFVGHGMLDAACPGAIFTSPTPDQINAAMAACEAGAGVLLIVKHYAGDLMNFEMAAEAYGPSCRLVAVADDASMPEHGRGVAGTLVVEKIVGARAERGGDLDSCTALAKRVVRHTRTLGVALTGCTIPAHGARTFDTGPCEFEFGVGIHGERGRRRAAFDEAETIAADMLDTIMRALPPGSRRVLLITNGLGATPLMELYLLHGLAQRLLASRGIEVTRSLVGNFCTSLDMPGCSFTITQLDDELCALWDAPVKTPALAW